MARPFVPKVVTASDLLEGDVVYMTATGKWSRSISDAVFFDEEVAAAKALASAELQQDRLVGAYLADVLIGAGGNPEPLHFREIFRSRGPSNHVEHGKQAEV